MGKNIVSLFKFRKIKSTRTERNPNYFPAPAKRQ